MSEFHKQSWGARFGAMGDQAEGIFDLVYPKHHALGLNRPPFGVGGMDRNMRYTPDRMTRKAFHEVMGIGRAQTLKIKTEKLAALEDWSKLGPTELFVYDSKNHRYWEAAVEQWDQAAEQHGNLKAFPEGKKYFELAANHFPSQPKDAPNVKTSPALLTSDTSLG